MSRFLSIRSLLVTLTLLGGVFAFWILTVTLRSSTHSWERLPNRVLALGAALQQGDDGNVSKILERIRNDLERGSLLGEEQALKLAGLLAESFDDFDALMKQSGGNVPTELSATHTAFLSKAALLPFDDPAVQTIFFNVWRERNSAPDVQVSDVFRRAELAALIQREFFDVSLPTEMPYDIELLKVFEREAIGEFAGRLLGASPQTFENVRAYLIESPGDELIRITLFDAARELLIDSDRRNLVNALRQELHGAAFPVPEFRATEAVHDATGIAEHLARIVSEREGGVPRPAMQMIERVNFHVGQAEQFLTAGDFSPAFHQANTAVFVGREALDLLSAKTVDYRSAISDLKSRFDELTRTMNDKGIELLPDFPFSTSIIAEELLDAESKLQTEGPTAFFGIQLQRIKLLVDALHEQVYGVR